MPTLKNFLDRDGLIQLLLNIEQLDETNIKDVYWSTDNADLLPTVMFKIGDDNGSAHSTKKLTFKGDTTSPAPQGATARSLTITLGGVDKTITYYDTDNTSDLATVATGKGAEMVQYSATKTVALAISDLENTIGGNGGSSITSLIEDLQEGDNIIEGSNITKTVDTTNHTVTITASDEKVAQSSDTTTSSAIPLLLASGTTPTSPAGTKYNSDLGFTPSTSTLKIGSGTLTATNYSGTAAKAVADSNGNDITTTYATKASLDTLSNKWTGQFKIASSAEATAISGNNAAGLELGYIYLVNDVNASSPNVYDEYIKVALGTTPETYSIEKIGTTDAGVDVVSIPATGTNSVASLWETYVTNA